MYDGQVLRLHDQPKQPNSISINEPNLTHIHQEYVTWCKIQFSVSYASEILEMKYL